MFGFKSKIILHHFQPMMLRRLAKVLCLALALAAFTGCPDKKKGNSNNDPTHRFPGYIGSYPTCASCQGYTDELAAGWASYTAGSLNLEMGLAVFSPTNVAGLNGAYQGPVTGAGYLLVHSGFSYNCAMQPGEYSLRMAQPNGNFSNTATFNLTGFQLEAVHRTIKNLVVPIAVDFLEFYENRPKQGPDKYTYPLGIYGQLRFCGDSRPGSGMQVFFPML